MTMMRFWLSLVLRPKSSRIRPTRPNKNGSSQGLKTFSGSIESTNDFHSTVKAEISSNACTQFGLTEFAAMPSAWIF